jgi:hypothetical protein
MKHESILNKLKGSIVANESFNNRFHVHKKTLDLSFIFHK